MTTLLTRYALRISILMIFFLLLLCLWFVFGVDIYSLRGDQMRWVGLIDKMYQGQLCWSDLWAPHGPHHNPAYRIIFLANAKYFNLNMQLEQILGAIAWAGAAAVAAWGIARHYAGNEQRLTMALVIITTPFLVINGQVFRTVLHYSLISLRMLNMMFFFLIFILLSRTLNREPRYVDSIILTLLIIFFSLFFGRSWGQAMLVTVFLTMLAYAFVRTRYLTREKIMKTIFPLALTVVACIFVYQIGLHWTTADESRLVKLLNFSSIIPYVITLFGRTLTNQNIDVAGGEDISLVMLVGSLVIAIYALAMYLFFSRKYYLNGWFPLCMMLFSLVAVISVYLGRGVTLGGGWQSALFPRHLPECSVGLVGALSIIALYVKQSRIWPMVIAALCIIIIINQSVAIVNTLDRIPFIARNEVKKLRVFFGPTSVFSDARNIKKAECHTRELCMDVRKVVDGYNLMKKGREKAKSSLRK